jgi:CRP-like cAMP-binding protein
MSELIETAMQREALAHAGFALIALAFIVRDPLVLHSRAIAAYGLFIGFAALAQAGPAWHLIGWYVLFLAINGGQVLRIVRERHFDRMTAEEAALAALAFPAMERCVARRLIRRGTWETLAAGEVLTAEGRFSDRLFAVLEGAVRIEAAGQVVCDLGPGQFVGEIGFIARCPATATAVAGSGTVRVLAWRQEELRCGAARHAGLRAALDAAIGADLARKIAGHTVQVTRAGAEGTAPSARPAPEAPMPRRAA